MMWPARQSQAAQSTTHHHTTHASGNPKGVVLTHRAVLSTIAGLAGFVDQVCQHVSE